MIKSQGRDAHSDWMSIDICRVCLATDPRLDDGNIGFLSNKDI